MKYTYEDGIIRGPDGSVLSVHELLDAANAPSEAVERDAARYRWLAGNIEMLPYPDTWAGKEWLDAEIDKRSGVSDHEGGSNA
jgi:hypothetical protein